MNKQLHLLFLFMPFFTFGQITFVPGQYVDNAGVNHEIWIKYADWKNNPSSIEYKISPQGEIQALETSQMKEFSVDGEAHYIRAVVPISRYSNSLQSLSNNGRFETVEETVLLKTLVDGEADLLKFERSGNQQFFFRLNNRDFQPLIYKRYIPEESTKVAENNQYKQDLLNALSCEDLSLEDFQSTRYRQRDLVNLFKFYNQCKGSQLINFTEDSERDAFNLRIRPGIQFSQLELSTYVNNRTVDFGSKTGLRVGIEGEYILPFFKNKWGFIAEPTYRSYQADAIFPEERYEDGTVGVKYSSIEVPLGVRHYFFLNNDNKLFLNLSYTIDFLVGESNFKFDTVSDTYNDTKLQTNTGTNFSIGGGYSFKKFSLEGRYNFERTLTGQESGTSTAYDSFSLIVGYQIL